METLHIRNGDLPGQQQLTELLDIYALCGTCAGRQWVGVVAGHPLRLSVALALGVAAQAARPRHGLVCVGQRPGRLGFILYYIILYYSISSPVLKWQRAAFDRYCFGRVSSLVLAICQVAILILHLDPAIICGQ